MNFLKWLLYLMAFVPWYLAFVPSKNWQWHSSNDLAPKMTKFQALLFIFFFFWDIVKILFFILQKNLYMCNIKL